MSVGAALRAILERRAGVVAPGVYDGLGATLLREAGHEVAYLTGAGVSAGTYGLPDIGLLGRGEMAAAAERVTDALADLPLVADADTGYGNALTVARTVRTYERAGAAAIQLEDQVFPKRCGHLADKTVVPVDAFTEVVRAAAAARTDPDTVILARTDAAAVTGIDDAIARARAYAAAGADAVFVEAPETVDDVRRIPTEVDVPVVFNHVPAGRTPAVGLAELRAWGYALVIVPGAAIAPLVGAVRTAMAGLRDDLPAATVDAGDPRDLFDLVGMTRWMELAAAATSGPGGSR